MKKIYTIKKALLVVAALFTCSMAFADDLSETFQTSSGAGSSNSAITGISYTIAGTYNAGGGGAQAGTMTSKGFKMRTGSDGNRCVFTVNAPYVVTGIELEGIGNYAANDTEHPEQPAYVVTKVEVDDVEISTWEGGKFPGKGSDATDILKITSISAKSSIAIYFDNSNAAGNQVNSTYTVYYQEPAASEPVITLTPDTVHLIPGATYRISSKIVPTTFNEECIWYAGTIEDFMENGGVSPENSIIELADSGKITAIGPGEIPVKLTWMGNPGVNEDTTVVIVTDFKAGEHKIAQHYDFTTMGDVELAISGESFKIWNAANNQCNPVQYCTNEGLENIAFQAVISEGNSKGWEIVDGKGLYLTGAGRCGAVGKLKTGQFIEFNYTGSIFASKDYSDPETNNKSMGPDAGAAKTVINEEVGRAIYQVKDKDGETEDLVVGFEINRGDYVTSITVYEEEADPTAINEIEPKANFNEGATYNFMGIKVGADAKGLLIKDGKVFFAK